MNRKTCAWLVFTFSLVIYAFTLAPGLGPGSSPAWIVNSMFFGLPYAPGNLLYLIVSAFAAQLSTWLLEPVARLISVLASSVFSGRIYLFAEPALAVNMVSMLSGAATASLCFTLLDRLAERMSGSYGGVKRLLVGLGSLFVTALPSIWISSVLAGPESFNLFLSVFLLWLLFRVHEGGSGGLILFWSFLLGLSFSHDLVFIFAMTGLVLFWRTRGHVGMAVKKNFGPMVFLFLFGSSIYIYLWLRPLVEAPLGRSPEFLSGDFWAYVFNWQAFKGSMSRRAEFFGSQAPLYFSYLKMQAGHLGIALSALGVFLYSIARLWSRDKKLLTGILVMLAVSVLAALWLANPRLGPAQALDKVPELWKHEPSDLDQRFLFSYLVFASGVVMGLCLLYTDLKALAELLMKKMQLDGGRVHGLLNRSLAAVLLIAPVSFIPLHWAGSDLSRYYAVSDRAINLLLGIEKESILFVSNELEYYPILYTNKILFKQTDNIIANYLWMSQGEYLKDLRKTRPPMPMGFNDGDIELLRHKRLSEPFQFKAGGLQAVYPEQTVLDTRTQALQDILSANGFKRPVFFSHRVPVNMLAGLQRYMARQGFVVRLYEKDPLTGPDSLNYWRSRQGDIALDIQRTGMLLWGGYRFRTTSGDTEPLPDIFGQVLEAYSVVHQVLGRALIEREQVDQAEANFLQCEYFSRSFEESLHGFAVQMAWAGKYETSKEFMNRYFESFPQDPMKWAGLAKVALENVDSLPATEMLLESIKIDPDFTLGFQKLIRLYDSMDKRVMASAFLSRWVARHKDDEAAARLWEEYSTTQTLPPEWPE
ncbi:MAG: DUF2723 domain-containing protein [Gemmatimonadota bacterium]|nr:DUF2723 domain-containing protein [Gemmatimonadota bacterium]